MLGDFTVKDAKFGRENQLSRIKIWYAEDNHSYMCHVCAKGFLDSNFNEAVIDKISVFQEIAPNFTYLQKSQFFKYNWNFLDQLLLPYKFYGRSM